MGHQLLDEGEAPAARGPGAAGLLHGVDVERAGAELGQDLPIGDGVAVAHQSHSPVRYTEHSAIVNPPEPVGAGILAGMARIFDVPGISCDHCKHAIESEVGTVSGVTRVEVSVADRTVTVDGTASDADITAAIDEAGYEVAGAR